MADDVILDKAASIERGLQRVLEEYKGDDNNLCTNQTKQDAIVLNLQRACERPSTSPCMSSANESWACRKTVVTRSPFTNL